MAFQLGAFQSDAFQIDQIDWMALLSEPFPSPRPVAQHQDLVSPVRFGANPAIDSMDWHRPLSEPYKKRRDPVADQPFLAYEPFKNNAANDQIDWFRALSEPGSEALKYRGKRPVPFQQSFIAPDREEASDPGENLEQDWFMPLSEPFDPIRKPVAEQQHYIAPTPFDLALGTMEWFRALQEPYLKVRQPVADQQDFIPGDVEEPIEPGLGQEYDWYMALSEPAKFLEPPHLSTALQALYSNPLVKASPFAEQLSNRSFVTAIHNETITLTGQMLSGSNIVYVTAKHEESPTLTAQHFANVYMEAVNQVVVSASHDSVFQIDAFQTNAFQVTQRIVAVLTAKVDTNQDDV